MRSPAAVEPAGKRAGALAALGWRTVSPSVRSRCCVAVCAASIRRPTRGTYPDALASRVCAAVYGPMRGERPAIDTARSPLCGVSGAWRPRIWLAGACPPRRRVRRAPPWRAAVRSTGRHRRAPGAQVLVDVRARVPAFKPPGKDELTRALREVADFRAPGQYVLHDWLAPQAAELAAAAAAPAPVPTPGNAADAAAPQRTGSAAAGAGGGARAGQGADAPARQGGGAARAVGETGSRGSPAPGREAGSPGAGAAPRAAGARLTKPSEGHESAPGGDGVGRGAVAGAPAPAADAAAAVRAGAPAAAAAKEKKERKRKRLVHAGEDGVPPPAPLPRRSPDEQAGRPAAEGQHRGPAAGAPASEAAARPGTGVGNHPVVASDAAGHSATPLAAGAAGAGGAAAEAPAHPAPAPGAAPGGAPEPPGLRSSLSASSGDYDTSWFAPHEGRPPAAYAPAASEAQCDAYVREYGAKHAVYFRLHQEIEATRRCGGPLHAGFKLSCIGGVVPKQCRACVQAKDPVPCGASSPA